ncbi:aspartate kinase [Gramella sp. AN32]|uniref:Aspartokinase n=1 Tax=Christiangramia antarctica TaxID=2058158 RepID=A0ABW5X0Y7_9FLAO|nr:aspartate kinase [Gramella sp. AN32]MCM4156863.1 aspartate kinase [Gramella sp. AN32]
MKVLKFGGTSVGSEGSIRNIKNIILAENEPKLLVLSAMSGVTNMLVSFSEAAKNGDRNAAEEIIQQLKKKHFSLISDLLESENQNQACQNYIQNRIEDLNNLFQQNWNEEIDSQIITIGEQMLTYIFSAFLSENNIQNTLLDAREFMQVDNLENPDTLEVGNRLNTYVKTLPESKIYITQGFVRKDKYGKISTLKRGGSDYSATIIGAALQANSVEIWTDISGIHNNDPRYVEGTHAVAQLSFEEAAELAYFGAKILHPQTISPVIGRNIPVYLKNTFTPEAEGTCISSKCHEKGLKAISAKDEITAIKIKSNRMLMAHGFLKKIFEVFDKYETSIDMITTSEIAISLTIDDVQHLDLIVEELREFGEISIDTNHSIICVVGEGLIEDKGTSRLFEILKDIPVRMISYGGSNNNISLLVNTQNKIEALKILNEKLFNNTVPEPVFG